MLIGMLDAGPSLIHGRSSTISEFLSDDFHGLVDGDHQGDFILELIEVRLGEAGLLLGPQIFNLLPSCR